MRARILLTLTVAVTTLFAAEAVLYAGGSSLGEPQDWYVSGLDEFVEALEVLDDAGVRSDLSFAGTSLVMLGLRTDVIEAELESVDVAHNLAVPDGHTSVQRRWLLEEAVPRVQPLRVVWGLASLDFNGGRPIKTIDLYEQARAGKVGFGGPIDRGLSQISRLSYYREFLRGPLFVRNLFGPPFPDPVQADRPLDSLMKSVTPWPFLEKSQQRFDALRSSLVADFHIGEREAEDFEFTLDEMLAEGIDVVLVLMPVPTEYLAAHDDGRESHESWVAYVRQQAAMRDIEVFDYTRLVPDERFADYNHVDEEGAHMLTQALVTELRALGW